MFILIDSSIRKNKNEVDTVNLSSFIEIERRKLYECLKECDSLLNAEVLHESENLDKLIVTYMKSQLQKTLCKDIVEIA